MSKTKKSIAEQALKEVENIKKSLTESSQDVISTILAEAAKEVIKNEISGSEDEDDSNDYDVIDDANSNSESDDEQETEDSADSAFAEEPAEDSAEAEDGSSDDSEDDGDEWSEFNDYKVGEDEYDLTGVDDDDKVLKVYKLLKDTDNVVVKKDGGKVEIQDNETGADYIIDLDDESVEKESEDTPEDDMSEGCIKEGDEDPAGFASDDDEDEYWDREAEKEDPLKSDSMRYLKKNESKKSRKTMKESKDVIIEVDLGYTDNYQNENPIQGLSNDEPSDKETLDAGVPTGTKKPWAGNGKSKGKPYQGGAKNESIEDDEPVVEEGADEEINETNISNSKHKIVKKLNHQSGPKQRNQSKNGETGKTSVSPTLESYARDLKKALKENKELKEAVIKIKGALQEALITNVNLGQFVKLVTENTTTQEEKVDILNRFNEAKTVEQSKALYESIRKDLNKDVKSAKSINESVMAVNESKANEKEIYQSEEMVDMINLMKRMGTF